MKIYGIRDVDLLISLSFSSHPPGGASIQFVSVLNFKCVKEKLHYLKEGLDCNNSGYGGKILVSIKFKE